jgi:hypothetical protein
MSEEIKYGYGVTTDTTDVNAGGSIPPGINENVTFVKAVFERLTDDETKEKLLIIHFEKDGAAIKDVVWPVDVERAKDMFENYPVNEVKREFPHLGLKKGDNPTLSQYIGLRFDELNTRIKHILMAFLKDEKSAITGQVNSYEELSNVVISKLTPYFGKPVRLKVVLNKSNYSELPRYGGFVEYDVNLAETKLKIGPKDVVVAAAKPGGGLPPGMGAATTVGSPSGMSAPPPPPPPPPAPAG